MTSIVYNQQEKTALMPQSMSDKIAMAQFLAESRLMPQGLDTPQKVFVSLQWGHELGLSPMVAINNIMVINGKPALGADIMHALVRSNPEYGGAAWEVQTEKEARVRITRISKFTETFIGHFSIEMAQRAGLLVKDVWKKYPERMLKHRALAFALRDAFPDVLAGIYTEEEAGETAMRNVTPSKDTGPAPTDPLPLTGRALEEQNIKEARKRIIAEIGEIVEALDPSKAPYFVSSEKDKIRSFIREIRLDEYGLIQLKEKASELVKELKKRQAGTDNRQTEKAEPDNPSSPPTEAFLSQREKTIEEIRKIINYLNPDALPFFSEEERAAEEAFMQNVGPYEQGLELLNERKVQLAVKLDERVLHFKPEFPWEPKEEEPAMLMESSADNKLIIGKPADDLFFGDKSETAKLAAMAEE